MAEFQQAHDDLQLKVIDKSCKGCPMDVAAQNAIYNLWDGTSQIDPSIDISQHAIVLGVVDRSGFDALTQFDLNEGVTCEGPKQRWGKFGKQVCGSPNIENQFSPIAQTRQAAGRMQEILEKRRDRIEFTRIEGADLDLGVAHRVYGFGIKITSRLKKTN